MLELMIFWFERLAWASSKTKQHDLTLQKFLFLCIVVQTIKSNAITLDLFTWNIAQTHKLRYLSKVFETLSNSEIFFGLLNARKFILGTLYQSILFWLFCLMVCMSQSTFMLGWLTSFLKILLLHSF